MIRNIVAASLLVCLAIPALAGWPGSGRPYPGKIMPPPGNCPKGNIPADGCQNAPAGVAQFPHGLDINSSGTQSWGSPTTGQTYVTRPSWNVAGVDYAVGIDRNVYPTDGNLKNPNTISGAGISVSGQNITISGNNITLDGYDFSLNGGWSVDITGSNNVISNCKADVPGATFLVNTDPAGTGNLITKCHIDAGTIAGAVGAASVQPNGGSTTFTYCWIMNNWAIGIVMNGFGYTTGNVPVFKYNIIGNTGYGWGPTGGNVHGDWFQSYNANPNTGGAQGTISNMIFSYNLFLQTASSSVINSQGLSIASANQAQGPVNTYTVSNNVFIAAANSELNQFVFTDNGNLVGTAFVTNNYVDQAGIAFGRWQVFNVNGAGPGHGPHNGVLSATGNLDLHTGAAAN